ncbi:hypothetical protein AHMF7605_21635 [Adhaeribacter arboris]|uniref:Uncharacterized protein n=1 Tax=Adhaeribacter arboris TaxID=2072846 RepID=A0A2T2YK75_9BACT|nr:hypothetical protein [Adhaeribacter arboris]PSR55917.1 hypothetical protein AHMF7605_21635 [Adhaeribacter arboris]
MTPLSNSLITRPELIVKLIKEDLKSNKLHFGLNLLEIIAEPYHSDLGSIILVLMGIPENNDSYYAFYHQQMVNFTALETSAFFNQLDVLAHKFYELLVKGYS